MERHVFDHFDAIHLLLSDAADLKRASAETSGQEIGDRLDDFMRDLSGSQHRIADMLRRKPSRQMVT